MRRATGRYRTTTLARQADLRLTTWNCYRGTIARGAQQLARLEPDLITLQECSQPRPGESVALWRGISPQQGVGVLAANSRWRIEALTVPGLPSTALAVHVVGATPFVLLALWTLRAPTYEACALAALRACRRLPTTHPLVIAGDFNSSPLPAKHGANHTEMVRILREECGVVSAYHAHLGVEFGAEPHPTHYWRWQQSAPWHIDYVFVPERWAERIRSVEVGSYHDWTDSDHRPLTVDLAL